MSENSSKNKRLFSRPNPSFSGLKDESFQCDICKKQFVSKFTKLRHMRSLHLVNTHKPKIRVCSSSAAKTEKHVCTICGKDFASASSKTKHEKNVHNVVGSKLVANLKCSECFKSYSFVSQFQEHIQEEHPSVQLTFEDLTFLSMDEFLKWKSDLEKKTISSFVSKRTYSKGCTIVHHFECHRSGKFKSRSEGKRNSKIKGSNKTGFFCPARIKMETSKEGQIKVSFQSTHLGHQCNIERINLNTAERKKIAAHLFAGVPTQIIMSNVSEAASEVSRLRLLKTQDIRNIARDFAINSGVQRSTDFFHSVDIWVKKMSGDYSPILAYKIPGELNDEYPELKEEDFLLCFMNEAQEEILKSYSSSVISIDSTHGTNGYNIQLTSIIVKDSNWEGFPVAFMWSNRQTEDVFRYFFFAIKKRLTVSPKAFMSDDFPAFYNAWVSAFGACEFNLICDWHVKRSWNTNLSSGQNSIQDLNKRQEVLNSLHILANETDKQTFHKLLDIQIRKFSEDPEMSNFGKYFTSTYVNRVAQWASCYRLNVNINTNMSAERWHRELKYDSDLQGKCDGRLDKAIHSLLKSLRLKLLDRLCSLARGKLTKKIILLRKTHDSVKDKCDEIIVLKENENKWIVPSLSNFGEVYKVKLLTLDESHSCDIRCNPCNVCIHQLSCSCPDSSIKYNFCKHMHIVAMKYTFQCPENENSENENSENEGCLDVITSDEEEEEIKEKDGIIKELNKKPKSTKEDAESAVRSFLAHMQNYTSDKQFSEIIGSMSTLKHKCDAIASIPKKPLINASKFFIINISDPPNKKITPQRKFPVIKPRNQLNVRYNENDKLRKLLSSEKE